MTLPRLPSPARRLPAFVLPGLCVALAAAGLAGAPGRADERATGEGASAVRVVRDVLYYEGEGSDERRHRLDLYLPRDQTGFPVLVFIHGGAWSRGDKNEF